MQTEATPISMVAYSSVCFVIAVMNFIPTLYHGQFYPWYSVGMFKNRRTKIIASIVTVVLLSGGVHAFFATRLSQQDCTSVEQYDSLTGSCYYECETDAECAEKARKVDAELAQFFDGSQTKLSHEDRTPVAKSKLAEGELLDAAYTGSETQGTIYTVADNLSLQPSPTTKDAQLWKLFVSVAGKKDVTQYVQSFEVFEDAENDTAASVWQSQAPGKWHVNVNAAYSDNKKDLVHTMIHEYGHIMSLNQTQVAQVEGACPRLTISEGCVNDTAYIKAFKGQFWEKYGEDIPANEGENSDEVSEFYAAQPDAFVSEYAATNFIEDFAESWAIFVTKSRPNGDSEKDQKVKFFYSYQELVQTRDRIRAAVAQNVSRER